MFHTNLNYFGDRPAIVQEDGQIVSYEQLAQRADAVFSNKCFSPGSLIAIECDNTLPTILAYIGALRNGYPALLIDAKLDNHLREDLYKHFQVSYVLEVSGDYRAFSKISTKAHPDLALLLSTSGSTGSSKLVKLTCSNLDNNARSIVKYLDLSEDDRPITSLPLHYSYGLSVLNSHLSIGAKILLTSKPVTIRKFWDMFREFEATSFSGVPATYGLLKQLRFERMDLPSLRTMTQAGGRLSSDLVKWFGELALSRGQKFFVMYGQTEATARIAYVPPANLLTNISSIGVVIPGGKLDLIDESGKVVQEYNKVGELRYSGPNVMMGYATCVDDLVKPDQLNGVLLTGDLAKRDENGFYYVVGRINRFIKLFGNRIGLDEMEVQLCDLGYDVAVTGLDDLLVVALRGGTEESAADLAMQISLRYRIHRSAIRVYTLENFPMSNSGKIMYGKLLESISNLVS